MRSPRPAPVARGLVLSAFLVLPSAAQAMTVRAFLDQLYAVRAKGLLLTSNDPQLRTIRAEAVRVLTGYDRERRAVLARGGRPRSCPPAGKSGRRAAARLLYADLLAIPPAARGISTDAAFRASMRRHYPCRR